MGARLNTVFHDGNRSVPAAVVYGHWAGDNPTDATETLTAFFETVEKHTADHRYQDPSYLAAKYVVYLASMGGRSEKFLDFLGVGVVVAADDCGPECIAYVDCSKRDEKSRPVIEFDEDGVENV